jgi:hypothetical protein
LQLTPEVEVWRFRTAGWVMVTLAVAEHPFASATVKLYVPAVRVNVPVPVYAPVPPVAVTVTIDVPPLQLIGVNVAVALNAVGCVMLPVVFDVQPLASVTVYEYGPAVTVNVPVPV